VVLSLVISKKRCHLQEVFMPYRKIFALIGVGFMFCLYATGPIPGAEAGLTSQMDTDMAALGKHLTAAGLPSNPGKIVGKTLCAGFGGGTVRCFLVTAIQSLDTELVVLNVHSIGNKLTASQVTFYGPRKGISWQFENERVDWVKICD
jgi:hypothetical protein